MLAAVLAALTLTAATGSAGTAAAGTCARGKVAVKIGKKRSCRPLAAALPRPSRVDQRLAVARSSLAGATKTLGPATVSAVERAFAKGLAVVDSRLQSKRKLQSVAHAVGCAPTGASTSSSFSSGGLSGTAVIGNGEATIGLGGTISGGGKTLKFSYEEDVCGQADTVPKCPTATGAVDAVKNTKQKISMEVTEGGKTVYSQTDTFLGKAKLHGQVAEDAKLDTLDIDDHETYQASGTKFTGTVVTSFHVRVNMRTGSYDPRGATVTYTDASGATTTSPSDQSFASFVDKQISTYRSHESGENGWLKPNTCATLEFSPGVDKIVLTQGQRGQLQAKVKADDGALASGGKWTLSDPANATFNPNTAKGPQAQFAYTVTKVGAGVKVKATLEATSPAGVAKQVWSEPTGGFQFKTSFTFTATVVDPDTGETTTITFVHEIDGISCTGDPFGTGAWNIHTAGTLTITPPGTSTPAVADVKGATFPNGKPITAPGGVGSLQLIEGSDGTLSFRRTETPPPVPVSGGGFQPPTIDQTVPVTTDAKCPAS